MASKFERIKDMEAFIAERGFVTIPQLCDEFNISKNTARSDVAELAEKGVINKRYGGVESITSASVPEFMERKATNSALKSRMGKAACGLLEEGDIIYIDSGSSALCILEYLDEFPKDITVITSSLNAIVLLAAAPQINTMVLPGTLIHRTSSFLSIDTFTSLPQYNITKAFIGTTGISVNGALSTSTQSLARLKSEAIRISEKSYLMADTSKLGHTCMSSFANISDFDAWIFESGSKDGKALAKQCGIKSIEV